MTSFFCRFAGITAWLIVVGSSSLAGAQSTEVLIGQGVELREQGHDEQALPLFERAFAQDPSGRPEAQLGLVQLGLGRFVEAELHLRGALQSGGAWVDQNRTPLELAHAAALEHLGTLEILGGVEGATLNINGEVVGTLPYAGALSLLVGGCTIEVTAPGYRRFSTELTIRAGERSRVTIQLTPLRADDTPAQSSDITGEGWFWPVVLTASALVVGGVILGIVLGTQPQAGSFTQGDAGSVFYALEGRL